MYGSIAYEDMITESRSERDSSASFSFEISDIKHGKALYFK